MHYVLNWEPNRIGSHRDAKQPVAIAARPQLRALSCCTTHVPMRGRGNARNLVSCVGPANLYT